MTTTLRSLRAGPRPHGARTTRRRAEAGILLALAIASVHLVPRAAGAPDAPALGVAATRADPVAAASPAPSADAPKECVLPARVVRPQHVRDAFSAVEWMDTWVRVAADGGVSVTTRLSSSGRRPLHAEVTVSFLSGAGGRLAMGARSYRLAGRPAEASTAPRRRVRVDTMRLLLDPATRCGLDRVAISQRGIGPTPLVP